MAAVQSAKLSKLTRKKSLPSLLRGSIEDSWDSHINTLTLPITTTQNAQLSSGYTIL